MPVSMQSRVVARFRGATLAGKMGFGVVIFCLSGMKVQRYGGIVVDGFCECKNPDGRHSIVGTYVFKN
jgi:hypothetical protein